MELFFWRGFLLHQGQQPLLLEVVVVEVLVEDDGVGRESKSPVFYLGEDPSGPSPPGVCQIFEPVGLGLGLALGVSESTTP